MTKEEYNKSEDWIRIREATKARDGYRCAICGTENQLEVHHENYIELAKYGKDINSEHLVTLCRNCHEKVTHMVDAAPKNKAERIKQMNEGGAMAVKIPSGLKSNFFKFGNIGANEICRQGISEFYRKENHNFKDYKSLKVGKRDGYSELTHSDIRTTILPQGANLYFYAIANFSQPDADSVCRWYMRGLSGYDACRKVLVDMEINSNKERSAV